MKLISAPTRLLPVLLTALLINPPAGFSASHREAPITALDTKADITDFFAFVSYDDPSKVTFLLNVDPLLEPGNGPNYFPFDDNILYAVRIDNNNAYDNFTMTAWIKTTEAVDTVVPAPDCFSQPKPCWPDVRAIEGAGIIWSASDAYNGMIPMALIYFLFEWLF